MKIRVQREDELWEILELPSEGVSVLDLEKEGGCLLAGNVNFYFNKDGYYKGPGRSMEAMTGTHSEESARAQIDEIEANRQVGDVLDSDTLTI